MNTQADQLTKTQARRVVYVDLSAAGLVTTTDALGTRASAAPPLLGWRYTVPILERLAAGPQGRTLGSASAFSLRPANAGNALRNSITRVADHLHRDGHVGLTMLLDALQITRDGLISIDRHAAPELQLTQKAHA